MRLSRRLTTNALVYALGLCPLPYPHSTYLPNFKFDSLVRPDYGE